MQFQQKVWSHSEKIWKLIQIAFEYIYSYIQSSERKKYVEKENPFALDKHKKVGGIVNDFNRFSA